MSEIINIIAKDLNKGVLKLFLGAGVSQGFNFPSWNQLLEALMTDESDIVDKADIGKLLDEIETKLEPYDYKVLIHKALYKNVDENLKLKLLTNSPLLLAIGSMCVGNIRGRIDHVFTLNYDDLLEQYISLLGLKVDSCFDYKRIKEKCDVRIEHLHGFIPQNLTPNIQDKANKIVLSPDSYRNVDNFSDTSFSEWMYNITLGYKFLFIGLSGDDDHIKRFLSGMSKKNPLYANANRGYWLMTENAYNKNHKYYEDLGFIVEKLNPEEYPDFLLECCRKASRLKNS